LSFFSKDGKETYRSDLMEFIVPNKEQHDLEFITISDDPIPPNLPGINEEFDYRNI
jgi:hypothetical protein